MRETRFRKGSRVTRVCRKRILAQLLFPHLKTDFCDTIETKAVVVISLDSRANSRQKSEKHELRFVRSHLCSNNPPLYVKSSVESRCSKRCLFSIRPRQMIGKSRVVVGRIEGILECLFFCLLSGGKSRFTDSCCSTRCKQNSLTGGKKLQNPIVDANSELRLNTNLQEDYPKKLFVFMQFVLHYLACHLSFVTMLQNVRGCRKTNL